MRKRRILLVFGTRPEAIKMCPLVKALKKSKAFYVFVCVTGQHRDMVFEVLKVFDVKPDFDLDIMREGQDLCDITHRVLVGVSEVLEGLMPDLVLVHGDTTTSFATALAAFYKQIPVGHVEAGLRTHHIYNPWPEEMNRQLTARIAAYHFAPTQLAKHHLLEEHVSGEIFVTGNTVVDALQFVTDKFAHDAALYHEQVRALRAAGYDTDRLDNGRRLVLITGHRREHFGEKFIDMAMGLKELSTKYDDVDFVYPVHPNPNVRDAITKAFCPGARKADLFSKEMGDRYPNFFFLTPLPYLAFVMLMSRCTFILTDSGGLQEEAPALGKPVLVMRETTERQEAIHSGAARLVGTSRTRIAEAASNLLDNPSACEEMSMAAYSYGDGSACQNIIDALLSSNTHI